MINLSNEHLQQQFIKEVFKEELEDCTREGIDMHGIVTFSDNADVLAFIDGKGGLLDWLDDTMAVPNATDQVFVNKILSMHEGHPRLIAPKVKKCGFGVRHFAGDVAYTADGWLEKNNDSPGQTAEIMGKSELKVLQECAQHMKDEQAAAASTGVASKKKKTSVSSAFRASVRQLMSKISGADPHYVRCVKPNMEKQPNKFALQDGSSSAALERCPRYCSDSPTRFCSSLKPQDFRPVLSMHRGGCCEEFRQAVKASSCEKQPIEC